MSRHKQDKNWKDFVQWGMGRKLHILPAHPWTVAAYLRWLDGRGEGDLAESVIKSISRVHILNGKRSPHDHPVITRTIVSIVRRRSSAPDRSNLFDDSAFISKRSGTEETSELAEVEQEPKTELQVMRRGISMRSTPKLVRRKKRPSM